MARGEPDSSTDFVINRRYVLHDIIGKGGMGIVFRAYDRLHEREVALKRVHLVAGMMVDSVGSTINLEHSHLALANEFKVSSTLRHPNIVEVYDYGFDINRTPFFTMEILPFGQTILDAGHHLSIQERLKLFIQLLHAIVYLHQRKIIHRDIKPANILVVDGQIKVLDFGLAGIFERSQSRASVEDQLMAGTLAYMPPEVLQHHESSFASDLYSLGVLGYELLAGKHPFNLDNISELVHQIMYELPDVNALDIDIELVHVFLRLLQKDQRDRYPSAQAVLDELHQILPAPLTSSLALQHTLHAPRMIGREQELAWLVDHLISVQQNDPKHVLVVGESGLGKSRLLEEFRTHALVKGAIVVRTQATEVKKLPYALWVPILRWIGLSMTDPSPQDIAVLRTILPDISDLVSPNTPDNVPTLTLSQGALHAYIQSLFVKIAHDTSQPLVFIVEDIHWAGEESLRLLHHVVASLRGLPLQWVISARHHHNLAPEFRALLQEITLTPLNNESMALMSESILGERGQSPEIVELIQRESQGNAFFVVEILRTLVHQVGSADQLGRMTLPPRLFIDGMATFIEQYLADCAIEDRHLLFVATLAGRQLDLSLLKIIAPTLDIKNWLAQHLNSGIFAVDDDDWQFAHDQILQLINSQIPDRQRPELHQQIALALVQIYGHESSQYSVTLAYHWHYAGDIVHEERYITLAGEQYLKIGLYDQAIEYFQQAGELIQALTISETRKQKKDVHNSQRLAMSYLGLGQYDVAWQHHWHAYEIMKTLEDRVGLGVCLGHLGDTALALGDLPRAYELYQSSLNEYTAMQNQRGLAHAYNQLGNVLYEMKDDKASREAFQKSLDISRQIGTEWGMAGTMIHGYKTREMSALNPDISSKIAALELAYELARQHGEIEVVASRLLDIGNVYYDVGNTESARNYYLRSLILWDTLNDTLQRAQITKFLGMLDTQEQNYQSAGQQFGMALALLDHNQSPQFMSEVYLELAHLFFVQNDYAQSLEILSFLLNDESVLDDIQDASEQLVNEISSRANLSSLTGAWEQGKQMDRADLYARYARKNT